MNSVENIKIAIIGGTGKIGSALVKRAVADGYQLRMLVRDPEKAPIFNAQVEMIVGDVRDANSIDILLDGCDCVISTLGQPQKASPVFTTAADNLIRAMKSKGIRRYIVVTGTGVDMPGDKKDTKSKLVSRMMSWMFPAIMSDKQKEARILMNSDIDWTLVRLPYVKQEPSSAPVKASLTHSPGKSIYREDVASFLLEQISGIQYIRKSPFISN